MTHSTMNIAECRLCHWNTGKTDNKVLKMSELTKENTLYNIKALMGSVHKHAHNPVNLSEPTHSNPVA